MYYRRSLLRNKANTRRIAGGIILDRYSIRMSTKVKNDYMIYKIKPTWADNYREICYINKR